MAVNHLAVNHLICFSGEKLSLVFNLGNTREGSPLRFFLLEKTKFSVNLQSLKAIFLDNEQK